MKNRGVCIPVIQEEFTVFINLACTALFGLLLGFNREWRRKPAGLRTHALTSLGAALPVAIISQMDPVGPDAYSRVIQGIVTGIGFIGAGVICQDSRRRIEGLTTAASTWVAAMIGLACGSGQIAAAGLTVGLALLLLTLGRTLEKKVTELRGKTRTDSSHEIKPPD